MEVYPEIVEQSLNSYRKWGRNWVKAYREVEKVSPAMAFMYLGKVPSLSMDERMALIEEYLRVDIQAKREFAMRVVMKDPLVTAICHPIKENLGVLAKYSFVSDAWQRVLWQEEGRKVYEIAPGLAEHLTHTEVHNVKTEYLQLPFKSISIQVPWQAHLVLPKKITDYMIENGFDNKSGLALEAVGDRPVECFIVSEGLYSGSTDSDPQRAWQITVIAGGQEATRGGLPDFACYSYELPLVAGKTVQECVALRERDVSTAIHVSNGSPDWKTYFYWILNFILYLSYEPTCEVQEIINSREYRQLKERIVKLPASPKKDKLKERLKTIPPESRLYVGRGHPRIPTVTEPGSGTPLTVRIMVTGHWRNQAFGTGWQEHKLIWIRPFWRGPIGAEHNPRRIAT